ncbi:MAG: hypothetical protein VKJ06_09505 [Vampirovibrionales bacterium]|nr:hypothetical protein [Vampirovibrionales bacterium]
MTSTNGKSAVMPPDEDIELVETTDEAGLVHYFEKVEEVDFEGQRYALLIYRGNEQDGFKGADDAEKPEHVHGEGCSHEHDDAEGGYDEEVVLMRVIVEDGTDVYEAIEDDDEFNKVLTYIENLEDDEEEPEA